MNSIFHVVDTTKTSPRHERMQATWIKLYMGQGIIPCHVNNFGRDAKSKLNDPRPLPYLKDVLSAYWKHNPSPADVVIWTNSDNGLDPKVLEWADHWVPKAGCITMRRPEDGHVGRDLFAFTHNWLKNNWNDIPDYILGACDFDLGMACLVRHAHGIKTDDLASLKKDIQPADSGQRLVLHEAHRSEWLTDDVDSRPSVRHNRRLFMEWSAKNQPHLRFSSVGILI